MVRDMSFKQPVGINFIIGSVTTFTGKPPNFNVLYLDPDTMLPVEFQTIAFDLEHANLYDQPIWYPIYNYTETYEMADLSPASFLKVSQ